MKTSVPKVLLEFDSCSQTFRIVQKFVGDSVCNMGLCLEVKGIDSLGVEVWYPTDPLPAWVKALIGAYVSSALKRESAIVAKIQANCDTEMLDWLDTHTRAYGLGWICQNSTIDKGVRLYETSDPDAKPTVREAIIVAMQKGL